MWNTDRRLLWICRAGRWRWAVLCLRSMRIHQVSHKQSQRWLQAKGHSSSTSQIFPIRNRSKPILPLYLRVSLLQGQNQKARRQLLTPFCQRGTDLPLSPAGLPLGLILLTEEHEMRWCPKEVALCGGPNPSSGPERRVGFGSQWGWFHRGFYVPSVWLPVIPGEKNFSCD